MAVTVSRSSSSSCISLIKITASAVVYIVYSFLFVAVGISVNATCYHNSFVDNVIDFSNMEVIRQLWLDSNTFRLFDVDV